MDWTLSPSADDKSATGHTGLKNLGCTCYMNSLLQQFFTIASIREGILAIPDKEAQPNDESILYQLKCIFAGLKATDRQFHNPKDFTLIFKNYENQIMNVLEQMDVDEFFNLLMDRLEPYMKQTKYEKLFKYHFAGLTANELICKGCPHSSEKQETYTSIILQVKNKRSILEGLDEFIKGEMLEGDNAYFCEKCNKKVNTLKRQCIYKLPRVLVLVLKRFDFDYDEMIKLKVNDYCEFPIELDMKPYTQEYLHSKENEGADVKFKSDDYYKYNLRGVIIHTGTAESGHYYSIIKNENSKWFEFNDTHVTEYDIEDLPNEAYGGVNNNNSDDVKKNEKSTNAYVLFYIRESDEYEEDEVDDFKLYSNNTAVSKYSNIQKDILDNIRADNFQYWVSKSIFSVEYCEFIQDLMVNYDTSNNFYKTFMITKNDNLDVFPMNRKNILNLNIDDSLFVNHYISANNVNDLIPLNHSMFRWVCSYFFSITLRSKEKKFIPIFMDIIKANINYNPENAIWLLEEFTSLDTISEFLVDCPVPDMKKLVAGILYCAMIKADKIVDKFDTNSDSTLLNFIKTMLYFLSKRNKFPGKDFTYLYYLIWRFSLLSFKSKEYLFSKNLVEYLVTYLNVKYKRAIPETEDLFKVIIREAQTKELSYKSMSKKERISPLEELLEKKALEKNQPPTDIYLLLTLIELIRASDINSAADNLYRIYTNNALKLADSGTVNFDEELIKLILNEVRSRQSMIHVAKLLGYLCFNEQNMSSMVLKILLDILNVNDSFEIDNTLKIFKSYLLIEDSLKEARVKKALSSYYDMLTENLRFYKFTEANIEFLIKLFNRHKLSALVDLSKDMFMKLRKWLKENPYPPLYTSSKTTTLLKKKVIQPQNINQMQFQTCKFIHKFSYSKLYSKKRGKKQPPWRHQQK
jgi:ubiquitin carboxyl-terminal hydrolase 9/24